MVQKTFWFKCNGRQSFVLKLSFLISLSQIVKKKKRYIRILIQQDLFEIDFHSWWHLSLDVQDLHLSHNMPFFSFPPVHVASQTTSVSIKRKWPIILRQYIFFVQMIMKTKTWVLPNVLFRGKDIVSPAWVNQEEPTMCEWHIKESRWWRPWQWPSRSPESRGGRSHPHSELVWTG